MSKKNPFGISEAAALFLSITIETALRRAMRKIDGKTDEEIMALVVDEQLRKANLMAKIKEH
jgi:hypothetical protein